jgi:nucleoside-diphosphate-sugar epimerase
MRVLVTGHLGYIGTHLVALFAICGWDPLPPSDREILRDVRSL